MFSRATVEERKGSVLRTEECETEIETEIGGAEEGREGGR